MVEIPEVFDLGVKGGNFDDIDLDLRLSTGGRICKKEVKEPRKAQEPKNQDLDYGDIVQSCSRSSFSLESVSDMETNSLVVDKRAMHALRRREAKKKMEEKNRKKMMKRESKRSIKERDSEEENEERSNKKEKVEGVACNEGGVGSSPARAFPPHVVAQMPYTCQWILNGFGYAAPFWYLGVEVNVVGAVGGFNMCDVEQNKAGCGEGSDRKAGSVESTLCSSNAGSGNMVPTLQGGSNGDSTSHSALSQIEKRQLNSSTASSTIRTPHRDASSCPVDNTQGTEENTASTNSSRSSPSFVQDVAYSETINIPDSSHNDVSNSNPGSTKGAEGEEHEPRTFRVSTTGNGPNGRTITGLLGRYTKTEVTITCTCHGSSFSPAEFVEHAGGTNVTHPLRHIVMIT